MVAKGQSYSFGAFDVSHRSDRNSCDNNLEESSGGRLLLLLLLLLFVMVEWSILLDVPSSSNKEKLLLLALEGTVATVSRRSVDGLPLVSPLVFSDKDRLRLIFPHPNIMKLWDVQRFNV